MSTCAPDYVCKVSILDGTDGRFMWQPLIYGVVGQILQPKADQTATTIVASRYRPGFAKFCSWEIIFIKDNDSVRVNCVQGDDKWDEKEEEREASSKLSMLLENRQSFFFQNKSKSTLRLTSNSNDFISLLTEHSRDIFCSDIFFFKRRKVTIFVQQICKRFVIATLLSLCGGTFGSSKAGATHILSTAVTHCSPNVRDLNTMIYSRKVVPSSTHLRWYWHRQLSPHNSDQIQFTATSSVEDNFVCVLEYLASRQTKLIVHPVRMFRAILTKPNRKYPRASLPCQTLLCFVWGDNLAIYFVSAKNRWVTLLICTCLVLTSARKFFAANFAVTPQPHLLLTALISKSDGNVQGGGEKSREKKASRNLARLKKVYFFSLGKA